MQVIINKKSCIEEQENWGYCAEGYIEIEYGGTIWYDDYGNFYTFVKEYVNNGECKRACVNLEFCKDLNDVCEHFVAKFKKLKTKKNENVSLKRSDENKGISNKVISTLLNKANNIVNKANNIVNKANNIVNSQHREPSYIGIARFRCKEGFDVRAVIKETKSDISFGEDGLYDIFYHASQVQAELYLMNNRKHNLYLNGKSITSKKIQYDIRSGAQDHVHGDYISNVRFYNSPDDLVRKVRHDYQEAIQINRIR